MIKKYSLKYKNVLITGASSGIGKELSRCFAAAGSNCILHSIPDDRDKLAVWAQELADSYSVKTWFMVENFLDPQGPEKLYQRIKTILPRIDVLVNNAGVMVYGNFHEVSLEKQEALVQINLSSYTVLMRLFLADMVAAGEGRILNVSSASAFQPCPHHAVYGAAKAYILNLSEAVNQELRGTGVLITVLCPSYTDTPLLKTEGFPRRVWWYRISGLSDPGKIARSGIRALQKGTAVYIPGIMNKIIHLMLVRLIPRRVQNALSFFVLKGTK